jgi:hypothetical protein
MPSDPYQQFLCRPVSAKPAKTKVRDLALFAARLALLVGRASALRLIRFRFLGLLRWFVFALGHCLLLFDREWSELCCSEDALSSLRRLLRDALASPAESSRAINRASCCLGRF